ncbi:hypothetical protein BCR33DRAFT_765564 [Rhizoclosmatium globosum]|uniref:Uncharacterized protein n=1 Tax=Rhizoclosmatium globosum TaxID=329046 RepID=A0A1Y2CE71_9FUNG|nr:hypothetical protein BCR33DRAFT_765564 [Rhizoclosmatium globosum]|eukprot:ORY45104.1 hypothetical protein BCR33DRAFT_765564 [Rhizoclosmatium globosum]
MEQSILDMDFSLDYKYHISTFNALIDIHNLQVKAISQVLSSIENESVPWPSLELSTAFASNPPIHWNNRQTQSSVKQHLETFLLPNMSEPTTLDQENPSFRILTLKRSYEAYIGKLAGTPILSNGTAVLSFVWNRIAVFERDLMNAPVSEYSSTKKKNVVVFPFSSIGMSFVGDAVEALKTELERCGREITKSESVKSPWYSWKRVEAVLQEFEKNVDATVQKWEEQVLTPWNQVQESVKAAQKEQQRRRELDRKAAQAQSHTQHLKDIQHLFEAEAAKESDLSVYPQVHRQETALPDSNLERLFQKPYLWREDLAESDLRFQHPPRKSHCIQRRMEVKHP